MAHEVDQQVAEAHFIYLTCFVFAQAAQNRAHPCQQFTRTERFGDIIIGAQVKPDQLVVFG